MVVFGCEPEPVTPNFFNAEVDGVVYTATVAGWGVDSSGAIPDLSITSQDSLGNQMILRCRGEVGQFTVSLTGAQAAATYVANGVSFFGTTGVIDVQVIASDRVQGIFIFEGLDVGESESTVSITRGEFSLGLPE
ncbi:MAG TPA: hypothetical protein DCE41_35125 [Cytophagales bacterium]|nr:hypothetical protein [Cytophagales bacterium]